MSVPQSCGSTHSADPTPSTSLNSRTKRGAASNPSQLESPSAYKIHAKCDACMRYDYHRNDSLSLPSASQRTPGGRCSQRQRRPPSGTSPPSADSLQVPAHRIPRPLSTLRAYHPCAARRASICTIVADSSPVRLPSRTAAAVPWSVICVETRASEES